MKAVAAYTPIEGAACWIETALRRNSLHLLAVLVVVARLLIHRTSPSLMTCNIRADADPPNRSAHLQETGVVNESLHVRSRG
ncbi:hypothetical protein FOHLNKBM_3624 [Methylobacterium longum]|nr:hypothetical protein FOHLNKBM_3624 [Methylobacterium longum]